MRLILLLIGLVEGWRRMSVEVGAICGVDKRARSGLWNLDYFA